jgi:hypothetical protein
MFVDGETNLSVYCSQNSSINLALTTLINLLLFFFYG